MLARCRQAAAFGIAWTYFYDLPQVPDGVARGLVDQRAEADAALEAMRRAVTG